MWILIILDGDAQAKCQILEDPALDQALKSLDRLDRLNGVSIRLTKALSRVKA